MLYVYAVYFPDESPSFVGAWEKFEDARAFCAGDYEEGPVPKAASSKKYRIAQLIWTAAAPKR